MESWKRANARYFDERAARYSKGNWQSAHLADPEEAVIRSFCRGLAVDIGSGPGQAVPLMASLADEVVAMDQSPEMLRLATHRRPRLVCDVHRMPLRSGHVSYAHLRMSIHYLSLGRIKLELARILRPHGRFGVISIVPYGEADESWFNERHRLKGKPQAWTPSEQQLCSALESHFRVVDSHEWTEKNLLSRSASSNGSERRDALLAHATDAPLSIRRLYQISKSDEDVSMRVKWIANVFERL